MVNFIALRDASSFKFVYIGQIYFLNLFSEYYNISSSGRDSTSSTNHHPGPKSDPECVAVYRHKITSELSGIISACINIYSKISKLTGLSKKRRALDNPKLVNGDVGKYHGRHHF